VELGFAPTSPEGGDAGAGERFLNLGRFPPFFSFYGDAGWDLDGPHEVAAMTQVEKKAFNPGL
jgi:hypothetical protein